MATDISAAATTYPSSSAPVGNGVVIHLPGLFEEGDKNEKKGILRERIPVTHNAEVYIIIWISVYSLKCHLYSLTRSERLGEETYRLRQSSPWYVQNIILRRVVYFIQISTA